MSSKWLLALCGAFFLSVCMWGAAASEPVKGGPDQLAKEEEKHLERLAAIDRLEELATENKNDTLLEKVKMLRENEQRRYDKACERLKRPHGKSEESEKSGKKDDAVKGGKGKPEEKATDQGEREEKEDREEREGKVKSDKDQEPAVEGKGKPEEKGKERDETKAKHGKER